MATLITKFEWVDKEPMLKSRYYVEFLNKNLKIEPQTITKIDLPKFSKGGWEEFEIKFYNFLDSRTFEELNKIISKPNEIYDIKINHLDPVGIAVGHWSIKAKIVSVDFGSLEYVDYKDDKDGLLVSFAKFSVESCEYIF